MHEFSMAIQIVETVTEQAKQRGASSVLSLEIEIGTLSGVVSEALDFALQEAIKNSLLETAEIKLIEVQAQAICKRCDHAFLLDDFFGVCTQCQSMEYEMVAGKELKIKSFRVDCG